MGIDYQKKGKVVIITLNRPEALNALDPQMYQEFSDACIGFRDDDESWVAVITGSGEKSFCAGADLKKSITSLMKRELIVPPSIRKGLKIYKPFIASMNGVAIGGGVEMALACDIRIASEKATFTMGEARWGLMPGQGGTQRLSRLVGIARAAELMFMTKTINAQEALSIGLVNKVVPQEKLVSTSLEWADEICKKGPLAIRAIKRAMLDGMNLPLDQGLELEDSLVKSLLATEDAKEGLEAFLEKRPPVFKAK
ncbi:MAG TPA: enoyl-CoA hydratase [Rikenellaceae bacterium]|nr:enoyl-CoA hydratase [Rikenellaceae bacterium]